MKSQLFPPVDRCLIAVAALACAGLVGTPASAQSGYTEWRFKAQAENLETGEVAQINERSGVGFASVPQPTLAGELLFKARPEVVGGQPQLKTSVDLSVSGTFAGRAVQAIGQAKAVLVDTLTVTAAPDFAGGVLRFPWQMSGQFSAHMQGSESYLSSVGWDFYQEAQLFSTGSGLAVKRLAKESFGFFPGPVPPGAANFIDYLELPFAFVDVPDTNRIEVDKPFGEGGVDEYRVNVTPGVEVAIDFHLFTGVSFALANIDYADLEAGHLAEFTHTATLPGVQLLNADGSPYAGEWSLSSANGISYTLLPVPEPGSWALWLAGLGLLGGLGARRRRR